MIMRLHPQSHQVNLATTGVLFEYYNLATTGVLLFEYNNTCRTKIIHHRLVQHAMKKL